MKEYAMFEWGSEDVDSELTTNEAPEEATNKDDLAVGIAAEHVVCAELILAGHNAYRTDQFVAYDLVAEVENRLIRVQVKGTRGLRPLPQIGQQHVLGYVWNCRRGKGTSRKYGIHEFDIVALVALDTYQVAYVPSALVRQGMHICVKGVRRSHHVRSFEACTFAEAMKQVPS